MTDILLIQPPIQDFYLTAKRTMPYGLAGIAAAVRQAGFTVAIFDALATTKSRLIPWPDKMDHLIPFFGRGDSSPFGLFHHFRHFGYSYEHLANQARDSGAILVGISSLFTAYSDTALETAAAVKKVCPQAYIVLGGHHPTALPESVMAHPAVDFVLRGDGEVGLPLLAKALSRGESLEGIPGLVWRRKNGALVQSPPAIVANLDHLPIPAFDLIDWRFYQRSGRGSLSIAASRGCPMHCTYCAVNADTYHGFRTRSVATVIAEMEAAFQCRPMGFIDFEDEHLCADPGWFLALLEAIGHRFGRWQPELRAMNGLYAPSLSKEVIRKMGQTGFKTLNLALITTSGTQLKRFRRPDIRSEMDRVLDLAREYGLNAVAYLIAAGPQQDPHDSVNDLIYLAKRRVLAGVSLFYPAPGSRDYQWCQKQDLLPPDFGLMRATALPLAHTTDRTQAVTLLRLGRILNFMKSLMDQGQTIPGPMSLSPTCPTEDRQNLGKQLLAAFFYDGRIRGVDLDGHIYDHRIDIQLSRQFIQGIQGIQLRGASA